jgi:hypothetical protein
MLTNEEKRVLCYSGDDPPTVPGTVTLDTPLESLNLNWRERDLPERIRTKHVHRLHPYLGKFIPQLVEIFLRRYFAPGGTVLDPFAGSGTTLVQANEMGVNAVGFDISAFNVLLCRAKTARYNLPLATQEILHAVDEAAGAAQGGAEQLPLWESVADPLGAPPDSADYLREWFAPRALQELLSYCQAVERGDYAYPDLLKVILSRSARSARLTTHFDLDFPKKPQREPYWCYKHSRTCSPTEEALKFLKRYSLDTVTRIRQFSAVQSAATVQVQHGDSRDVTVPYADGIVTSPPYVGLIDYHNQHAYAYHLLGLRDMSHREIGAASNGSSIKAKLAYQEGIAEVFRNALSSLPSGAPIIVVAGDRLDLYPEIARMVGVETEAIVQRHVNRRTGRRANEFYESVFVWRKP